METPKTEQADETLAALNHMRSVVRSLDVAQRFYVAARLNLGDAFQGDAQSAATLASRTSCHPRSMRQFLRGLVADGVVVQDEDGRFRLTGLGRLLCSDEARSLRDDIISNFHTMGPVLRAMQYSVETGRSAFEFVHGMSYFDYIEGTAEAKRFHDRMAQTAAVEVSAIIELYDFSAASKIIDVGGGDGTVLRAILDAHRSVTGVLFDLPQAAARTRGLTGMPDERLEVVAGSCVDSVPAGGDVYLLSWVLHLWDDDDALRILGNCRRAMSPGPGSLLVVEKFLPPRAVPPSSYDQMLKASPSEYMLQVDLMDFRMLTIYGGLERTADEYSQLLASAGFEVVRVGRLPGSVRDANLIEARPIG